MYPISMNKVFKPYSSDLSKYKERSIKCQKDKKKGNCKITLACIYPGQKLDC